MLGYDPGGDDCQMKDAVPEAHQGRLIWSHADGQFVNSTPIGYRPGLFGEVAGMEE